MQTEDIAPRPKVVCAGRSDIGRARQFNEDSVLVRPDLALFAVADGAGGHNSGTLAATLGLSTLATYFEGTERAALGAPEVDSFGLLTGARRLVAAVQHANREICDIAATATKRSGMGSTLVSISFSRRARVAHIAHLGDSRCYRLRGGYLDQLTEDHCFRQDILEIRPDMPDEDLAKLPLHTVTRGLGLEKTARVTVRSIETAPGDTFLLCSDGLSGAIARRHIRDLLACPASVEARVSALIDAANEAGGRDNIAVVLVECESLPEAPYEAPKAQPKDGVSAFPARPPNTSSPELFLLSMVEASDPDHS